MNLAAKASFSKTISQKLLNSRFVPALLKYSIGLQILVSLPSVYPAINQHVVLPDSANELQYCLYSFLSASLIGVGECAFGASEG